MSIILTEIKSTKDNCDERKFDGIHGGEKVQSHCKNNQHVEKQLGSTFNKPWYQIHSLIGGSTMDQKDTCQALNHIKTNQHGNDGNSCITHKVNISWLPIVVVCIIASYIKMFLYEAINILK